MADVIRIRGEMLPGDAVTELFIQDGVFVQQPDGEDRVESLLDGGFITPGLVDVHSHLQLESPKGGSPEEAARASAKIELEAGVLALREPGGPAGSSSWVGPAEGLPRTVTAGRFLAPPNRYVGFQREVEAHELAVAAVDELSRSSGWAKIVGDWIDPAQGHIAPNYDFDALSAAAEAVHAAGGRLAVHAGLRETIESAVEAGVDSIEHGLDIGPDLAAKMAARGTAFTPTGIAMQTVPEFMASIGASDQDVRWWAEVVDRFPATIRGASEAGVRILAGTDSGLVAHGLVSKEIAFLHSCGLSAEAALAAGSWDAREYLGFPGIEPGAPADLVAYASDPRDDLEALGTPTLIIFDGIVIQRV